MPSLREHSAKKLLGWSVAIAGLLFLGAAGASYMQGGSLEGLLVRQQKETYPWKSISPEMVMSGTTIPANTNVVFHLPETGFLRINREVLLGHKGKRARYWGYCFPANDEPATVSKRTGFPGLLFLSEQERAVRAAAERKPKFTVSHLPTAQEIEEMAQRRATTIRHQLEVFKPATMCFIMSEESLSIGLDPDDDRLNDQLERQLKTDPTLPDTDGDGISDGVEFTHDLDPMVRDTDGDGLIDGIEDKDWDGNIDYGETDPRNRDSDRDGLCDGQCRVRLRRQNIFLGEDKNLNGVLDQGETNPNKWDSDGNGQSDEIEVLRCLASGKEALACP